MRITFEVTGDTTPEDLLRAASALTMLAQPVAELREALDKSGFTPAELKDNPPVPLAPEPPPPPAAPEPPKADSNAPPAGLGFGAQPTAPSAPPPPPPPQDAPASTGADLDAEGLPWDARIHAGTKAKIQDGTWRRKRGVDPDVVAGVEAELRGVQAAPAPAAAPPPPPPAAEPSPTTFPELMKWLTGHMSAGRLKSVDNAEVCKGLGVVDANGNGAITLLSGRPDLIPAAHAALAERLA